ncbi:MAG: response regulator [Desulfobacterales bacterium]|jgi:PAS domain S-box-containing protein|nr:response regulator [Desulfobacterales bacterium]
MTKFILLTNNWGRENYLVNTASLVFIAGLMLSYAIAFPYLFETLGPAVRLLPIVYLLLAALLWGLWGGLATGAVTFLINLLLHEKFHFQFEGGLIGPFAGLITIVMVGRLSDLSRGLALQLNERHILDERLQMSETKYRTLFEMESDCLALLESETFRILEVNQAATELFGYSREDLLGANALPLSAEPERTLAFMRNRIQRTPIRYLRKKDGTIFPCEIKARHFELQGQKVSLMVIRDITERIEAEQQRMLTDKQHQQSQKLEAIGTLAGGIAHDFNNILGGILGYTDLLQLQEISWDQKSNSYLEQIRKAIHRAKDLIHQILTFSRQSEDSKQPVLIIPIIMEALKLLRATVPARIEIRQHIKADKDTVIADATQIHQIIINLCTNAYHAITSGNGLIDVTVANRHLDEKFAELHPEIEPGNYLLITVTDTGHGMDQQVLERIFQPYFTTKKDRGSGLGLSVVHGIVSGHKGCVTVESEPGNGSSFHVYLPLAIADADMTGETARQIAGGSERILLVDDEPAIIEMMKDVLERMHYVVEFRTSSLEALALIRAKPRHFDLLITDMNMPHMTGIELRMQAAQIYPDFPVIIMTGFSEGMDRDKAVKLGFKRLLMKPVSFRDLAGAVREVLDERDSAGVLFDAADPPQ